VPARLEPSVQALHDNALEAGNSRLVAFPAHALEHFDANCEAREEDESGKYHDTHQGDGRECGT
jgi:hypothetical protein